VAAAFYLVGRTNHNARARETGLLAAEALLDTGIVVAALKTVSQRQRPPVDHASGEFFDRGTSFPSGHAANAWALATVVAKEYGQHRPLVRFGAYGIATAVSLSRYTGTNHFLSDILIGSAIGYGIGSYVYREHHDSSLDNESGRSRKRASPSQDCSLRSRQHIAGAVTLMGLCSGGVCEVSPAKLGWYFTTLPTGYFAGGGFCGPGSDPRRQESQGGRFLPWRPSPLPS